MLRELSKRALTLDFILITHHHADHIGGIRRLKKEFPTAKVFGPGCGRIPCLDQIVSDGDKIDLGNLGSYQILEVPGHTTSHVAYYGEESLFIGDTVFAAGCGRLFEGTATQMVTSFNKVRKLPLDTMIYCAHEYTLSNIRFAKEADPENIQLRNREEYCKNLRKQGIPTIPFTLEEELNTNPFFRCRSKEIQESASNYCGQIIDNEIDAFAVIRQWKNSF